MHQQIAFQKKTQQIGTWEFLFIWSHCPFSDYKLLQFVSHISLSIVTSLQHQTPHISYGYWNNIFDNIFKLPTTIPCSQFTGTACNGVSLNLIKVQPYNQFTGRACNGVSPNLIPCTTVWPSTLGNVYLDSTYFRFVFVSKLFSCFFQYGNPQKQMIFVSSCNSQSAKFHWILYHCF